MKLKNRVFKGAIADCDLMENGKITEKGLKKYEELSKLEIGTIITGGMLLEPHKIIPVPSLEKDDYIKELKKLPEVVHKNGVNIIAQVSMMGDLSISPAEIHRLTDLFADAVARVKAAGFDGVEIGANHFGTLSQFLSPMFNHRTDEYGGSDENRARIIIEIIQKIKKKLEMNIF